MLPTAQIDRIAARFEEIEAQLAAGHGDLVKLSKERAQLKPVADALAEDVAIAIRPANLSPDVSVEPPGWVRDAGPQHALIRFAAAPTQRQLQRVEQVLRDEGLL